MHGGVEGRHGGDAVEGAGPDLGAQLAGTGGLEQRRVLRQLVGEEGQEGREPGAVEEQVFQRHVGRGRRQPLSQRIFEGQRAVFVQVEQQAGGGDDLGEGGHVEERVFGDVAADPAAQAPVPHLGATGREGPQEHALGEERVEAPHDSPSRKVRRAASASRRTRAPSTTGTFTVAWPMAKPAAQGRPVSCASERSTCWLV